MKPYERITERILEALRNGTVPWRKRWHTTGMPRSLATGKRYRGINVFMLGLTEYSSPWWATFNQITKRGGKVTKGSKSSPCVFWKFIDKVNADTGERERFPMLRLYNVFNLDQTDGVEAPNVDNVADRNHTPVEIAENMVREWIGKPVIESGEPSYSVTFDVVRIPKPERFESVESYYSVLFHELSHSTGHKTRLAREMGDHFGGSKYSQEELIAEMASCFLCDYVGILNNATIESSASYIENWRHKLSKDPKIIVQSAARAQRAADMIAGIVFDD